ncbi:MAG: IS3 family transposase [Bacteroidia bacterium]
MKAHAHEFPVEKMSNIFDVSRSGYYAWLKRDREEPALHADLDKEIKASFSKSRKSYGSPRITEYLAKQGISTSKSTVARRMKVLRIKAKRSRKYITTTNSKHHEPIAPNLLNREFQASQPAQKWVGDITYLKVGRCWFYLTVVIDLADRAVIGWALSDNMTAQHTTIKAFKHALNNRKPNKEMMFHSDRGVQYACQDFRDLLDEHAIAQSMSRKGNCWDNAVAESFFKTIKAECLHHEQFANYQQAYSAIFNYIDGWYNTLRIHSTLGGKSPHEHYSAMTNLKMAA